MFEEKVLEKRVESLSGDGFADEHERELVRVCVCARVRVRMCLPAVSHFSMVIRRGRGCNCWLFVVCLYLGGANESGNARTSRCGVFRLRRRWRRRAHSRRGGGGGGATNGSYAKMYVTFSCLARKIRCNALFVANDCCACVVRFVVCFYAQFLKRQNPARTMFRDRSFPSSTLRRVFV